MKNIKADKIFFPFQPIRERHDFFVGRTKFIEKALDSISTEGSCTIFYGERQVGKTSLGNQILNIVNERIPEYQETFKNFKSVWYDCKQSDQNIEGALSALVTSEGKNSLQSVFKVAFEDSRTIKLKEKISIIYSSLFGSDPVAKKGKYHFGEVFHLFQQILDIIHDYYPQSRVLIFLDEFDRLSRKDGIGDLIKSTYNAQFIFIGIAENIEEIIYDHQSAGRKLYGNLFKIPTLNNDELTEIFLRAEVQSEGKIQFDKKFIRQACDDSGGLPGFIHLIGLYAIRMKKKEIDEPIRIEANDYPIIVNEILGLDEIETSNFLDPRLTMLNDIIKNDRNSMEILSILSEFNKGLRLTDLYDKVSPDFRGFFDSRIRNLLDNQIIRTQGDRIKFQDPLIKIGMKVLK
ncbi:MAG TPA: hypothetical protein DCR93_13440 [Cytophagales bacterium]|nr:hypothetical protein [Cytophagales bacterium]HAP60445.1 hypothetical protein [Cytophagales bacterium]